MKKAVQTEFDKYMQTLSAEENAVVSDFFADVRVHLALPRDEKDRMLADYEAAILYYASVGTPVSAALERLAVKNIGGFYARPAVLWFALDDAAKVYPLSMEHGRMAVFRLSIRLKKEVVPQLLQIALTFVIKRFPCFATTLKKGFFWHYLDTAKRRFSIETEADIPCRPMPISHSGSQSFRVVYFNNRISAEFFHVLTDGSGGMVFLKTLVAEYLRLAGDIQAIPEGIPNINEIPTAKETANEFLRADRSIKGSGFTDRSATQMTGLLSRRRPCRVLHFNMDAELLSNAAKQRGATITAYMLSLLFIAGKTATDVQSGEENIQVPVNMRKFYPSSTLRNFSLYCGVRLPLESIGDPSSMIPNITEQLQRKASREAMGEMMASTEKMVSMVRYVPLIIKAPVAKVIYGFLGDKLFCNTLSNLGVVKLPDEMARHIESMDFVLGTAITNRVSCSMVTFGGVAVLSIAKMTADPTFEEKLYELLTADGIPVEAEGSELHAN